MIPCLVCHRHVRTDATVCPFCSSPLRDGAAPTPIFAGLLLGLAMMAASCGGDDGETTGTSNTQGSATQGTTMTGGSTGDTSTTDTVSAGVSDYGDPSFTDSLTDTISGTDSSGGTSGGSDSSSGTDTGSTTAATNASDTADYGAPGSTGP